MRIRKIIALLLVCVLCVGLLPNGVKVKALSSEELLVIGGLTIIENGEWKVGNGFSYETDKYTVCLNDGGWGYDLMLHGDIGGVELKQGTDYTVTYWVKDEKINPNAIKFAADEQHLWITVKITGKGNYADETFESGYSVKRVAKNSTVFDLTKAKIYAKGTKKAVPKQGYLGEPIEPAVDVYVKVGSTWQLVDESLYEVHYINNIERGTAKIVVVGDGEKAVGNKKANFKIVKWQFSLLSLF